MGLDRDIPSEITNAEPESIAERNRQIEALVHETLASRLTPQGIEDLRSGKGNIELSFGALKLIRQFDDPSSLSEDHPQEPHFHLGFRHESEDKIIEANVAYSVDPSKTAPLSADFSNHSAFYEPNAPQLQQPPSLGQTVEYLRTSGILPNAPKS